MHVALSGDEILMTRQFLSGARRWATHREMRAERVTQDVHAHVAEVRAARRSSDQPLHLTLR
jgi:hypothetical protein